MRVHSPEYITPAQKKKSGMSGLAVFLRDSVPFRSGHAVGTFAVVDNYSNYNVTPCFKSMMLRVCMYAFIGARTDPQIPWVPHKLVLQLFHKHACMKTEKHVFILIYL